MAGSGGGFGNTVRSGLRIVDRLKRSVEPTIDKYLALAAANTGVVYGAAEFIDRSDLSDPTNALMMMGTGAALAAGNYVALASERTRDLRERSARLNARVDRNRPLSWVKSTALAAAVTYFGLQLSPYFQQVYQDFFPSDSEVSSTPTEKPGKTRLKCKELGYNPLVVHNFSGTKLADRDSMVGRIQRTLRWQKIYRSVEAAYGMPQDTLAGMIMQESYGNPVQPNATDDGGLGVVHIQGTTAHRYGLDIYGNSTRSSDMAHGKNIRKMLAECSYDAACAQKYDDRAHMIKVLDAAARIVSEGKRKHGSWDRGVEYYRAPGKVGRNTTWRYLDKVRRWRKGIDDPRMLERAAQDFEERNGYSFADYLDKWDNMSNNWGLAEYNRMVN